MFEDDGPTRDSTSGSEESTTIISVAVSPQDRAKIQAAVAALQQGRKTPLTVEDFVVGAAVQVAKQTLFIESI